MQERVEKLKQKLLEIYGNTGKKITVVRAPGRINLIGDYTEVHEGYALPLAVDPTLFVAVRRRNDALLSVYSMDFEEKIEAPLATLKFNREHGWANYPKSVLWSLQNAGHKFEGFEMVISGNIPQGVGCASSSALTAAVALAVTLLGNWSWDVRRMAKLCQRAESQFIGVSCGMMDSLAVMASVAGHALFLDCRSLHYENIPIAFQGAQFVLVNSGVSRRLKSDAYDARREEWDQALKLLQTKNSKYLSLRDVGQVAFERYKSVLPESIRPCIEHVVYENDRVLRAKEALVQGKVELFGSLLIKSHRSLKKNYERVSQELDALVEMALEIKGVYGSRLIGAGLGGCTVQLVAETALPAFQEILVKQYRQKFNIQPDVKICQSASAASEVI